MSTASSIRNVTFSYANSSDGALNSLDLEIGQGKCVLLCGASGCGKTTVTRLLNGLIPHYYEGELDGEVTVFGKDIRDTAIEDLAGTVGSVFQNPRSQFFCVDTTAEIAFGCENMGLAEPEILSRVNKTVKDMKIEKLLGRSIFNLSGGEKQKIACAGVSAMLPELIVLDEPTSNLDLDAIAELREIIAEWKAQGKTIVIAEHRLGWLSGLCDRVIYLKNGSIVSELSGNEFFSFDTDRLNKMGLRAFTVKQNYLDSPKGISAIKPFKSSGNISLRYFTYSYGRHKALDIDSFDIPAGSVTAVVGHNGAGKSTFTKCLCGLQKGFKGVVNIDGKACRPMSLSGGQKQRVAIASALLAGKKLLVFDEPTSGLDLGCMECTADLLRSLGKDITVLIVTHDMELIDRCCTHILHIEGGEVDI